MAVTFRDRVVRRAKRWLVGKPRYLDLTTPATVRPSYLDDAPLADGEEIIGVYENTPGRRRDAVAISDRGILVSEDIRWSHIPFPDIREVSADEEQSKRSVDHLWVVTGAGKRFSVPVRGGEGRFRDAWSFLSFLLNVIHEVQRPLRGLHLGP